MVIVQRGLKNHYEGACDRMTFTLRMAKLLQSMQNSIIFESEKK